MSGISISLEPTRGKSIKNVIAEIYCNGEKLTLFENEKGELMLEGRYGEIGKNDNPLSIQQVAKDLQYKNGKGLPIHQMIEDIRQRKMYVEMEQEAKRILEDEFQSIKKEMRSEGISGSEEPPFLDLKNGCKPFKDVYKKNADIEGLPYPEAAYWSYVTGIGVYFGLVEKRDEMRKDAIAELETLCVLIDHSR